MGTRSRGGLAPVEAEPGWQQWRGVEISSRSGEAHELAIVRDLVDRLHAAGLTYAIREVWCDSRAGMYTVGLKPGAQAPWVFFQAEVQAWVDETWHHARIEGVPLGIVELQPDEGDPAAAVGDAVALLELALRLLRRVAGKRGT